MDAAGASAASVAAHGEQLQLTLSEKAENRRGSQHIWLGRKPSRKPKAVPAYEEPLASINFIAGAGRGQAWFWCAHAWAWSW